MSDLRSASVHTFSHPSSLLLFLFAVRDQALKDCIELFGPDHSLTLMAMAERSASSLDEGNDEEAERMLRRVVLAQGESIDAISSLSQHARVLLRLGRVEEGMACARKAASLSSAILGPDHYDTMNAVLQGLSYSLGYEKDRKTLVESERVCADVIGRCSRILGSQHHLTQEATRLHCDIRKRVD